MHVAQRFLLLHAIDMMRVYDPLAQLVARRLGAERGDVERHFAAAARPALVMTRHARVGVVDGAKAVAARTQRILRLPRVVEQHLAGLGHRRIDARHGGLRPAEPAQPGWNEGKEQGETEPDAIGAGHRGTPLTARRYGARDVTRLLFCRSARANATSNLGCLGWLLNAGASSDSNRCRAGVRASRGPRARERSIPGGGRNARCAARPRCRRTRARCC